MKKMGLFWFAAALLGAALIFSGCEGETTTETNTVLIGYDVEVDNLADLAAALAANSGYSYVAYNYGTLSFDGGGSFTIPAGKTLGLFQPITYVAGVPNGTLAVNGVLNVEVNGELPGGSFSLISGPVNVKAGGAFTTSGPVAGLPAHLSVTGGELKYDATATAAGNIADGGSITTLLGKVSRGKLIIGSTAIGPVAITAAATGLSKNKILEVTTTTHAASGTGPEPLIIPVGLILTTPGLTSVTDVTVQGGGRLIFSGAPGSLSLAAGSAFTLNEGGEFEALTTTASGSKGLVLGNNSGSISITGDWAGGSGNATITGAAAGGTVSGKLGSSKANSKINIGTFSALSLEKNAGIDITGGTIAMVGTASTDGATIYFGESTGILFSGGDAKPFPAGTIADIVGTQGTGIVYGTLGGTLVSITSTSASVGSIAAGTAHTAGYKALDLTHQTAVAAQ